MLHIFHRLVSPYYLQIYRFQFRLNLYLQLVPSLLPKMCFNPILHTINNDNHSLPTYWSANLNHVKKSFIHKFVYLPPLTQFMPHPCRTLTWMFKLYCKICYFQNNTHKPDSSITIFPRMRYRLEKKLMHGNCNHNQIAIHLKYF